MPKFPEPPSPAALRLIPPIWKELHIGAELWRIYFRGGPFPSSWNRFRTYGPLKSARFDHHAPAVPDRAILYAAGLDQPGDEPITTCLAEFFQESRVIDRTFNEPWLAGFQLTQDLLLLDLTGVWPTRAGASMAINSGRRDRSRRWSTAIYDAYAEAQGLWYASSMYGNRPAVALYERSAAAMPSRPLFHRPLADPLLLVPLQRAAHDLNYDLT